MTFADKSFKERFETMGDPAEECFEEIAPKQGATIVRWGLNRPPFLHLPKVNPVIRHAPDYLCEARGGHFFVDCKGSGGRVVKVKQESLDAYEYWENLHTVYFFIFDSNGQRWTIVSLEGIKNLTGLVTPQYFSNDNKKYYALDADDFIWRDRKDTDNGKA